MEELLLMWDKCNLITSPNLDLNYVINDNRLVDFSTLALRYYGEENIPKYNNQTHLRKDFEGFAKVILDKNISSGFLPYEMMYFSKGNLRFGQSSFKINNTVPVILQGYLSDKTQNVDVRLIEFYHVYPDNIYDKDDETILLQGHDFFLSNRVREFYHSLKDRVLSQIKQFTNGDLSFKLIKYPINGMVFSNEGKGILEALIEFDINEKDISSDKSEIYQFLNDPNEYITFFKNKDVKLKITEHNFYKDKLFDPSNPYKKARYKIKEEKFENALKILNNIN